MQSRHEEPSLLRLELLGYLAAAARLAMVEAPNADGVVFTVTATGGEFAVDCTHFVGEQAVSGWGQ